MAVIKIVPMPGAVGDKGDEGAVGPRGQQGETGLQGPAGADALWSYNGEWQANSSYATGDIVTYQGQLYYTKSVTTAGTLPTNTTKFDLIAAKGTDGQAGTNGSNGAPGAGFGIFYLGNYNPSAGYVPDIAVVRGSDGQLYLAKASGQLGDPVGNTAQWEVWIPKGADGAQGEQGPQGEVGPMPFNYQGDFNYGVTYAGNDAVTFNGGLWKLNNFIGAAGYAPTPGQWTLILSSPTGATGTFQTSDSKIVVVASGIITSIESLT
jgi:hypothetical protein